MSVHNVELIRCYVLRKLKDLRIYVSCLQPAERDALSAMEGAKGQQVAAKIADYVLQQLGHDLPPPTGKDSRTLDAARRIVGKGANNGSTA